MTWSSRVCPICTTPATRVEVVAPVRADDLNFNEVEPYWRGFRKSSCFFDYYRCVNCYLLFNKHYFNEEQLDYLYKSMPDNSDGVEHKVLAKTQEGYLNFLTKNALIKINSNYLEIGPDIGLLTYHVAKTGLFSNLTLVEPNTAVHNALLESINKLSKVSIVSDFNFRDELLFDVVAGIHVFDHLIDPVSYIKKIANSQNQGSFILSVTHDEGSFLRTILKKKWLPFCLQHPQLYNKTTLTKLFKTCSYEEIKISNSTNWFPLKHFFEIAIKIFDLPNSILNLIPSLNIPIRLGNKVSIYQKK